MATNLSKKLQKAATVKKSDKPIFGAMKALVDQTVQMKKELEDLNQQKKEYSSSILCEGTKTDGCMVVFSDKFSNLPIESEAELRKLDKDYERHFVEARKIEVKENRQNNS
jgi:hypothetical protein